MATKLEVQRYLRTFHAKLKVFDILFWDDRLKKKTMKSPMTGKEMSFRQETKTLNYRGESFSITAHYYLCEDSGQRFTTTESDTEDLQQVYNQYRQRHGIPTPEEIKSIRKKYKVSAAKMSRILGLGANQYRLYETGEMPSLSNARLILLMADEQNFQKLARLVSGSAI